MKITCSELSRRRNKVLTGNSVVISLKTGAAWSTVVVTRSTTWQALVEIDAAVQAHVVLEAGDLTFGELIHAAVVRVAVGKGQR